MATDEIDDAVMLFVGSSRPDASGQVAYSDATWLWKGHNWHRLVLLDGPPARSGAVLVSLGGRLLLFGGSGTSGFRTDTWIYGRVGPP